MGSSYFFVWQKQTNKLLSTELADSLYNIFFLVWEIISFFFFVLFWGGGKHFPFGGGGGGGGGGEEHTLIFSSPDPR